MRSKREIKKILAELPEKVRKIFLNRVEEYKIYQSDANQIAYDVFYSLGVGIEPIRGEYYDQLKCNDGDGSSLALAGEILTERWFSDRDISEGEEEIVFGNIQIQFSRIAPKRAELPVEILEDIHSIVFRVIAQCQQEQDVGEPTVKELKEERDSFTTPKNFGDILREVARQQEEEGDPTVEELERLMASQQG